ncbi:hypothetical protein SD70_19335 [Gordoniibacillus kamchatkensis]|uniref:Uncharacterized protein n=1 Tax=Gordoniibacillus kamchatkensis TaxID=1590651 RepID=A0ABR5AEW4_9BACL|nr:hypothetical protein [Paenibacillus sp. VKM B-2647]KIL39559.1 hypothetical protein SD70_19335 [Paenibacillus sp. VKM B-2647]
MKRFSLWLMLTLACFLAFGSSVAFADVSDGTTGTKNSSVISIPINAGDRPYFEKVWDSLGTDGSYMQLDFTSMSENQNTDTRMLTYDKNKGILEYHDDNFRSATAKSRKKALGLFVENLQSSRVSKSTQDDIYQHLTMANDEISRMMVPLMMDKTSADLYTAGKWVSPFIPTIRVIVGVAVFIITFFLIATSILDLLFIGMPMARERMVKKDGQKISWVTHDAESVVREVESSISSVGGYKNPYWLYLRRRVFTYIILALCLLYLIAGELGGLISWLLQLMSGVV